MSSSRLRRSLLAIALSIGTWLTAAGPAPAATAVPAPTTAPVVAPTLPATTSTTTPRRTTPPPEEPWEFGDAVDWAKDHLVPIIVVVGLVLVIGLWKFISRPRSRKF